MESLGDHDRQFVRPERQQQCCDNDADQRTARGTSLVARGIHQCAGGKLADQRDDGAEGEGEADLDLGPFVRRQIDRDERPEAGLHVGDEEIQQIERPRTAHLKMCRRVAWIIAALRAPPRPAWDW